VTSVTVTVTPVRPAAVALVALASVAAVLCGNAFLRKRAKAPVRSLAGAVAVALKAPPPTTLRLALPEVNACGCCQIGGKLETGGGGGGWAWSSLM